MGGSLGVLEVCQDIHGKIGLIERRKRGKDREEEGEGLGGDG